MNLLNSWADYMLTFDSSVPGRPLEDIMMGYIQVSNQRDLSRLQADAFQKLRLFTKGLKISINLPGHRGKKPKTIRDLVQRVGERVFDKGGVKVTVAVGTTVSGTDIN